MKEYKYLKIDKTYPSGIVQIDRPDKKNALNIELLKELKDAVESLNRDENVRGIIISGHEKFFSTGIDLNETLKVKDIAAYRDELSPYWHRLNDAIEKSANPVIAAINGYCVTGGFEMALACDIRIAGKSAKFSITSSKIGTVAGAGGTQRLPRLVGPAIAKELLMTARFVEAEEASRMGILNKVVEDHKVLDSAKEMVDVFSQRAPLSLWWAKMVVNNGMNMSLDSAIAFEGALTTQAFMTEDKAEGIQAFLEKRKPNFKGK